MRIFDCFMYFDEDVVLDVRLNTLNDYVDKTLLDKKKIEELNYGKMLAGNVQQEFLLDKEFSSSFFNILIFFCKIIFPESSFELTK